MFIVADLVSLKNLLWNHEANNSGERYKLIEPLVIDAHVIGFFTLYAVSPGRGVTSFLSVICW